VGKERATPDGCQLLAGSGGQSVGETADGTPAGIEETGLAGERLPALDDPDEIGAAGTQVAPGDDRDLTADAVQLGEILAQAACDLGRVQLSLDGDPARDDVQSAREPQQCGELRRPHGRLADLDACEFLFDVGRQCHA
jgi:hypothetical protein